MPVQLPRGCRRADAPVHAALLHRLPDIAKAGSELRITSGNELKLVYRQKDAPPEAYADLAFDFFFLQPMDGPSREAETAAAIDYCRTHPQWRLSLQTHKMLGIP